MCLYFPQSLWLIFFKQFNICPNSLVVHQNSSGILASWFSPKHLVSVSKSHFSCQWLLCPTLSLVWLNIKTHIMTTKIPFMWKKQYEKLNISSKRSLSLYIRLHRKYWGSPLCSHMCNICFGSVCMSGLGNSNPTRGTFENINTLPDTEDTNTQTSKRNVDTVNSTPEGCCSKQVEKTQLQSKF